MRQNLGALYDNVVVLKGEQLDPTKLILDLEYALGDRSVLEEEKIPHPPPKKKKNIPCFKVFFLFYQGGGAMITWIYSSVLL